MTPDELVDHFERVELMAEIGSWRWEPAAVVLWWSPGMHRIFGTSPDAWDGRQEALFEATHHEDRPLLIEAAKRFEQTGIPELIAYRIVRPDGEVRNVWAHGETMRGEQDEVGAYGYVFDVTERVQTETRLRREHEVIVAQNAERFRSLVLGAPLPTMVHAEGGEVLLLNRRWVELTGYTHEDLPTIETWTAKAYRNKAKGLRAVIAGLYELSSVADGGRVEVHTKDGSVRTWQFSSAPAGVLADGRRVVVSMAADLTAERELRGPAGSPTRGDRARLRDP